MLPPKAEAFPNPRDACCARVLWWLLLVVYVIYAALATAGLSEDIFEAESLELNEERISIPSPSVDVCELLSVSAALNYSILPNVRVKVQSGWYLRDGNESHDEAKLSSSAQYVAEEAFRCLRFSSTIQIPAGAAVTYFNFWIGVKEPVHEKLYRWNENYIGGLIFRPSLAQNATNSFAVKEERLMRVFVPSSKMPGFRNVVISAVPSLAKWTDSLGGRRGAPCEDTFYFSDLTLIPETLQREGLSNVTENAVDTNTVRYTLKLDMPLPTRLVEVYLYTNNIGTAILNWLSKIGSATAVFKLITVLFPTIERKRYRLFRHLPWLGLGEEPSERDPLVKSPEP